MSDKVRTYAKPLVLVAALAAACAVGHVWGVDAALLDGSAQEALSAVAEGNMAQAVALFCVLTVVGCVILALPGALFAVVAAALFGPFAGTFWCVLSATVGAVLSFLVGRCFLRDSVRPWACKNEMLRRWLFSGSCRNAVITLAVTRLVPLFPFNIQNFAYGATDVSLGVYAGCTLVFMVPGTALYAFGAAGVLDAENRAAYLAAAALIALAVFGVGAALRRRYLGDAGADEGAAL